MQNQLTDSQPGQSQPHPDESPLDNEASLCKIVWHRSWPFLLVKSQHKPKLG